MYLVFKLVIYNLFETSANTRFHRFLWSPYNRATELSIKYGHNNVTIFGQLINKYSK